MPDKLREKVFNRFDIEKELNQIADIQEKKDLKPIPKDWIKELYYFVITNINDISYRLQEDKQSFTLFFNSIKNRDEFETKFRNTFLGLVNQFIIREKKENPKEFKRSLICTTIPEKLTLKILY